MAIASGSRVRLAYVEESTHGTTPSLPGPGNPQLKTLRATERNINLTKEILKSAEVRSTRQEADVRHGFNQVVGAPGYQLSLSDFDDMIRFALSGTWAAVTTGTATISTTSPSTFTRTGGSFITDGFRPGDWITSSGFTNPANNGTFLAVTVSATVITIAQTTLATEGSGGDETIVVQGKRMDVGLTLTTMSLERQFVDVAQYQLFRGVAVNQMSMAISPKAIVTGALNLVGMSAAAFSSTSVSGTTPDAASTNQPFAAFEGSLYENGTAIAVATSLDWNINNQRTLEGVIGSRFSPDVFEGVALVNGSLTAFFQDATLVNKFVNETESSLWLRLLGTNGTDFIAVNFHRLKYTGGDMNPPQIGPVPLVLPFTALEHATYGTSVSIQRSNAS